MVCEGDLRGAGPGPNAFACGLDCAKRTGAIGCIPHFADALITIGVLDHFFKPRHISNVQTA